MSSYHEVVGRKLHNFEEVMAGVDMRVRENTHFKTQSESLSATSSSGRPIRVHFVGRLEAMDVDWARLDLALESAGSPHDRMRQIPSRREVRNRTGVIWNKRPGTDHTPRQPIAKGGDENNTKPFTENVVLNTCRAYVQDLVCFGYGIPEVCIDHAAMLT